VSAAYGLPFAYAGNLREALEFIDWHRFPDKRFTVNWMGLYDWFGGIGLLPMAQRLSLAELMNRKQIPRNIGNSR
jgi:hypothetical protein